LQHEAHYDMPRKAPKKTPSRTRERLAVSITLEEASDFDLLVERAREAGLPHSTYARNLVVESLHTDPRQVMYEVLQQVEERMELHHRNIARAAWMVLRAMELREAGQAVPDAKEWVKKIILADF